MNDTIKKVINYIGKYKIYMVASLVLAFVYVCVSLYIPIMIGKGIDCISGDGVNFKELVYIIRKIAITIIIGGIAQWLMNICNNQITYGVIKDIRYQAFSHLQKLPLSYLDTQKRGDLVSRMVADIDQFADGLLMGFTQFFTGVITILGTIVFMLRINLYLTLVVVVLTPISFFVASFVAKHTHDMFEAQSKTRGEQTAFMDEVITNLKLVKAYGREDEICEEFKEINQRLSDCSLKAIFYSSLLNPSTRFVNSLVYAAVAVFGALFAINGKISIGMLTSFLSYGSQYTKPFNEISGVITELQNALVCANRVFELLELETESEVMSTIRIANVGKEKRNTIRVMSTGNTVNYEMFEKNEIDNEVMSTQIALKNVSFSYVADKPLIENLNLTVPYGTHVAIVGPTGCGKTTLINLLMRFYDVKDGGIFIDNTNIKDISRSELRSRFGMVLQETWIREGSVFENITLGRDIDRETVIQAAKATGAHSFIKRMSDGYDTILSEDDGALSAGQKQLLCITRVMALIPPMLILDEATSSIDTMTEKRIAAAFDKMMDGRTSFVVAHRLSTILNSDIILCMKDGHIEEMGTHTELLGKNGFYASIYNAQYAGLSAIK